MFASFTKPFQPQPFFFTQKRTIIRDPSGRILQETRKSSKSIMFVSFPIIETPERTEKPRIAGSDRTRSAEALRITDFFFVIFQSSDDIETIFSKTAITVVNAAKVINRKKRVPHILPPVMLAKTFGRVLNSREGPASG